MSQRVPKIFAQKEATQNAQDLENRCVAPILFTNSRETNRTSTLVQAAQELSTLKDRFMTIMDSQVIGTVTVPLLCKQR